MPAGVRATGGIWGGPVGSWVGFSALFDWPRLCRSRPGSGGKGVVQWDRRAMGGCREAPVGGDVEWQQ